MTVSQTVEDEQFGVPTVGLELASGREESVHVRVVVELPPELSITEVGFHPEYRRDDWRVVEDRLLFEAEVPSGGEVTTMYAVDSLESDQRAKLLENLYIERVSAEGAPTARGTGVGSMDAHEPKVGEELLDTDGVDTEESPMLVTAGTDDGEPAAGTGESEDEADPTGGRDGQGGDTDERTPPAHESNGAPTEDTLRNPGAGSGTDTGDSDDPVTDTGDATDTDGETHDGTAEDAAAARARAGDLSEYAVGDLLAELASRIEADELAEDDREHLGTLTRRARSDSAVPEELRVSHLQQRVSDVEAFLGPLQGADGERTHPADLLDEIMERLETLGEQVEAIDETREARGELVADIEQRLDGLEDETAELRETVDGRGADLEPRLESVESDIESIEDRHDRLESEVSTLNDWQAQFKRALNSLNE